MFNDKIVVFTNNDSSQLNTLTTALATAGYEIHPVMSEEEILNQPGDKSPDLIIKNISNDAESDIEIIKLIRADKKLNLTPILAVGEIGENSVTVVEALNAGADDYLKLPIESLVLVRKAAQIIERRRNEKLIGKRENYSQALIENGTDIITVITMDGKIIYESPSIEPILGYQQKELIGKNCLDFIYPDDQNLLYQYYAEIIRHNGLKPAPITYRFKHKNGSWRVLESFCKFVKDYLEEFVIIVNSRDITRRRSEEKSRFRLQNKLAESETRFKLALRAAKMIWWEWNPQQNRIILADNFPDVYGTPKIKDIKDGFVLLHPEDKERHLALFKKISETGGDYHAEFRIIREDNGNVVWLEESALAFLDDQKQVQKVVGIAVDITERKKSENALRESEERFKAQYEHLPVPSYTWKKVGDDFVLSDFNGAAYEASYKKIPRLIGRTAREIISDVPEFKQAMIDCFQTKNPVSFEMSYKYRMTDEVKQIIFSLAYIPPNSVSVYTHDVTEFRETINSLEKSENRFRLVSRATNDVLWDWNIVTGNLWWNENVFRSFGYSEETFCSTMDFWYGNIHPADYEKIRNSIKNTIDSDQIFWAGEYRFQQGDGSYAYVFDRAYIERDETGKAVRMLGAMMNVTKRKWAEIELLESKERLALAQQIANIGSFDLDIKSGRVITSGQLEKIYGAEPNFNYDFNNWLKFVYPDDVEIVEKNLQIALESGEHNSEFRIFSVDGKLHWLQCCLKVFYDENNQPERLVGVNMDITERKFAEEALRKSQEQLLQSQKLESVGRLAGAIAHDFNNMLTAINGYSDLILKSLKDDDPIRRKVLEIKKAGERSVDLTKQLLAFSRRQVLQPKLIDLNQFLSETSRLFKRLIGEDINMRIEFCKEPCCIMADPGQVSQVIMNLIVNARDAMPEGGDLLVEVSKVYVDEKHFAKQDLKQVGEYILLSVKDTGIGIDEKNIQFIFEPFFTTKQIGTGLGLSTVYGIVKQSRGCIFVDSKVGEGSVFNIFLPSVKREITAQKPKDQEKRCTRGNEKILLVEDEDSVRKLLSQLLQSHGYSIIEAANGLQALRVCKEIEKIDLLLTDIIMPQMGGSKLSEEIKKCYPQIKILYMSGYIGDKTLLNGELIPEKNFISKPVASDVLAEKIRQVLDGKD